MPLEKEMIFLRELENLRRVYYVCRFTELNVLSLYVSSPF